MLNSLANPPNFTETTDVIVIGTGFAGLMAAIKLAQSGVSVKILDKRSSCGGNSIISDGVLVATGSSIQKKSGINDSAECLLEDMLIAGHSNQVELASIVAEQASDICEWLEKDLQVAFRQRVDQFGGHKVARSLTPIKALGTTIIHPMLEHLKSFGIIPQVRSQVIALSQDETGRINGVKVIPFKKNKHDKPIDNQPAQWIKARKAVILATGGFSADIDFRQQLDPRLDSTISCTNIKYTTAECMQAAIAVGADTVDMEHIQLAPFTSPDEKGYGVSAQFSSYTVFPYGLLINPVTGKRFVNEMADRKSRVDAMLALAQPCIGIADDVGIGLSGQPIDKCLKRKVVNKFSNLQELAAAYDIPERSLQRSIERYNTFIRIKQDKDFQKPILASALPLNPPYYAVRLWPKAHYTMGGLRINSRAQVMHESGHAIRGLYAAGEVTSGVHGISRLSTTAITECLVFGRIAGQQAAMEIV
ncbi:MAG: Fumarate reductase flavoprotein subunit (EC [uncultured Thiotrichaceae bacterium]|uniref:Fumarate reductase flavoprotein subunit (EC) n=1 Tax=uncultured Thiotrichaceae bacterium TaxID=298394 RepID=A0A6S6UK07_9GAMM|nr:MAG: Fumarate reductase flavoprotein subunit (EC [uncultured Thiotrichaceae bacterium]